MATTPPLPGDPPQHARLIDTGPICYPSPAGLAWRKCRTWITADGIALSVVSELPGDEGKSVTNAAEQIATSLRGTRPGYQVRVIEHYPADSSGPERYAEQLLDDDGTVSWRPVEEAELLELLGETLHTTNPAREDIPQ